MIEGLTLPFISEADPEIAGEGSIDPLGLAPLADRLAGTIAPGVTARMWRVRFVTAIAVGAPIRDALEDFVPADGVSTPALALEWLLVESLARNNSLPEGAVSRVPGIQKARAAIARKGHLDARSYLKTPTVFGYHGVYKRLAIALGVVDSSIALLERGDRLVRAWEREQEMLGYTDRAPDSRGNSFARRLQQAVERALANGGVQESYHVELWRELSQTLRPNGFGRAEGGLVKEWLLDPSEPVRAELVAAVERAGPVEYEADVLRTLRPNASGELAVRLDAIEAYERFATALQCAFDILRRASTGSGTRPVNGKDLVAHELVAQILRELPASFEEASESLASLGLQLEFEELFRRFGGTLTSVELYEEILAHHDSVQKRKPPGGKRSWFEVTEAGAFVRPAYRVAEAPALADVYLHPYRVSAIRSFLDDLA